MNLFEKQNRFSKKQKTKTIKDFDLKTLRKKNQLITNWGLSVLYIYIKQLYGHYILYIFVKSVLIW